MSVHATIDADMTMDAVMRTWPETVRVVLEHGMLCVGCPVGPFHTVTEASHAHHLDEDELLQSLLAAIGREEASGPAPSLGDQQ